MSDEPLTLGGIKLVLDPQIPPDCAYFIPRPPALPGESYFAFKRRCLRMGVKLINLSRVKP